MENSRNCRTPSRAGHSIVDYFFGSSHFIQITPRFISGWWLEPLWKIWVRQLGWWNSQYMEKIIQPCSKAIISIINYRSIKSILRYIKSSFIYITNTVISVISCIGCGHSPHFLLGEVSTDGPYTPAYALRPSPTIAKLMHITIYWLSRLHWRIWL